MLARPLSLILLASGIAVTAISMPASSAGFQLGAKPQQLLYVEMDVSDFATSRSFYETVLGLKELPGSNPDGKAHQSAMLSFSGGFDDTFLTISHDASAGAAPPPGRPRKLTLKVHDIAAVIARARSAGIHVLQTAGPAHGIPGMLSATVADPDGVTVELVQFPDG